MLHFPFSIIQRGQIMADSAIWMCKYCRGSGRNNSALSTFEEMCMCVYVRARETEKEGEREDRDRRNREREREMVR